MHVENIEITKTEMKEIKKSLGVEEPRNRAERRQKEKEERKNKNKKKYLQF